MRTTDRDAVLGFLASARASSAAWIRGACPFCVGRLGKADRRGSFGVSRRTGAYNCFRCAARGKIPQALLGVNYIAAETVWDGVPAEVAQPSTIHAPEGFFALADPLERTSPALRPARRYLTKRGVSDALVAEAGIGACPSGYYTGRVIVPVLGEDGTWLWWVGRAWSKLAERPYMYPRGGRGDTLYNHAALLVETDEPVIVVEGVFDALAYWPDAVAVLGKPTPAQLYALASARRPVCVVLDGDAWEEGEMLALRLRLEGACAGAVRLAPRVDPDEVDKAWLRAEARASVQTL